MQGASTDQRLAAPDERRAEPTRLAGSPRRRFGGTDGNEILTSTTALVLSVLLLAEGVTILRLGSLLIEHMFIGIALLPPVALKLASTGYRFARFYSGARPYRDKGPPALPLRVMAPVLVAATLGVFGSGLALLLVGHRASPLTLIHKVTFIVWGVCFAVHFLSYLPRMLSSVRADWSAAHGVRVSGAGIRRALLFASTVGGLLLALTLLSLIGEWHR